MKGRTAMKKILAVFGMLLLLSAPAAFGDEIDDDLPSGASERLRANVREMVRLGADDAECVRMTRLMIQNRFQEEQMLRVQQSVMETLKEGLPAAPVMNKAFEGMAKGAGPDSIVRAMEQTRSRYSYAYEKAGEISGPGANSGRTGEIIAEGMTAGLTRGDADRIADAVGSMSRERDLDRSRDRVDALARESFLAARDMTRRGVASETASEAVSLALAKGYDERGMRELRHSFARQSSQADPSMIAEQYCRAIRGGAQPDGLETAGGPRETSPGHGYSADPGGQRGASGPGGDEGGPSGGSTGGGSDRGRGGSGRGR